MRETHFFGSEPYCLQHMLEQCPSVTEVQAVPEAYVPVLKIEVGCSHRTGDVPLPGALGMLQSSFHYRQQHSQASICELVLAAIQRSDVCAALVLTSSTSNGVLPATLLQTPSRCPCLLTSCNSGVLLLLLSLPVAQLELSRSSALVCYSSRSAPHNPQPSQSSSCHNGASLAG
jgi:hypothetical protein